MKRLALLLCIVALCILSAQDLSRKVRSIKISSDSNTKGLFSVTFPEVQAAWQKDNVKLAIERPLDLGSLQKAEESIHALYRTKGQKVRVTHEIAEISPRSLEISFKIAQQD